MNARLANALFTLSAEGVCGASVLAVSYALSAPDRYVEQQGRYVVLLTNSTSNAPLHVQPRVVFTDAGGTSTTVVHTLCLASNAQAYGGSAPQANGLVTLLSGQGALLPLEMVAGSALQIWVLAASTIASTIYVSGAAALWRI